MIYYKYIYIGYSSHYFSLLHIVKNSCSNSPCTLSFCVHSWITLCKRDYAAFSSQEKRLCEFVRITHIESKNLECHFLLFHDPIENALFINSFITFLCSCHLRATGYRSECWTKHSESAFTGISVWCTFAVVLWRRNTLITARRNMSFRRSIVSWNSWKPSRVTVADGCTATTTSMRRNPGSGVTVLSAQLWTVTRRWSQRTRHLITELQPFSISLLMWLKRIWLCNTKCDSSEVLSVAVPTSSFCGTGRSPQQKTWQAALRTC